MKSDEKALFEMKNDEKALFEMKSDEKALFEMKSDEKALSDEEVVGDEGRDYPAPTIMRRSIVASRKHLQILDAQL